MFFAFGYDSNLLSLPKTEFLPWLTYSHSLTEKLKHHVGEEPSLKIIQQIWQQTGSWEKACLNVKEKKAVFQREILMSVKGIDCWYARTIIPKKTYAGQKELFARLINESLGQLIFNNDLISRISLNLSLITPKTFEYEFVKPFLPDSEPAWGRLSTFSVAVKDKFYLLEIFLPGLLKVVAHEIH